VDSNAMDLPVNNTPYSPFGLKVTLQAADPLKPAFGTGLQCWLLSQLKSWPPCPLGSAML
jgi:hypothetical protein